MVLQNNRKGNGEYCSKIIFSKNLKYTYKMKYTYSFRDNDVFIWFVLPVQCLWKCLVKLKILGTESFFKRHFNGSLYDSSVKWSLYRNEYFVG